ncbi:MAG TPA: hypothetical protein VEY93_15145 [Longimicrobium sp.]|nr:hypothetical protein [Longimicrobium sp.]
MHRRFQLSGRPLTPETVRAGKLFAMLALMNTAVVAAAFLLSGVATVLPAVERSLRDSGDVQVIVVPVLLVSIFGVWLFAVYLVQRDPALSARAWTRWTAALLLLNLVAGQAYVIRWWLRLRNAGSGAEREPPARGDPRALRRHTDVNGIRVVPRVRRER